MNRMVGLRVSIVLLAGAASCSEHATTPAAPATVIGVSSVSIAQLPTDFAVDDSAQLSASAAMSDGTRQDVTALARWSSSTLACVITPTGLLRGVQSGECAVNASLGTAAGTLSVIVAPARFFTITGVVREKYQPREPGIASARVVITSGPQSGREVQADGGGRFTFDRVPRGVVSARVEAGGFDAQTVEFSPESAQTEILLAPEAVTITYDNRVRGDISESLEIPFHVTHQGPATLVKTLQSQECFTAYDGFGADVRRAGSTESVFPGFFCGPGTREVNVFMTPGNYVFKVWRYRDWSGNRLTFAELTHPR